MCVRDCLSLRFRAYFFRFFLLLFCLFRRHELMIHARDRWATIEYIDFYLEYVAINRICIERERDG